MELSDDGSILLNVRYSDLQNGEFIIPNSDTQIGHSAFVRCTNLTQITIPASVTHIGDRAFEGCSSLTAITIPASVTHIGDWAFCDCSSLTAITIPNSVTHIGVGAFSSCSSLTAITIPASVTYFGKQAFCGCSSLTAITIPNSVTHIGLLALAGCSSLTAITIPNSVTHIHTGAFALCSSLTAINIPHSVTHISNVAFDSCSNLTQVILPGSLNKIGDRVFESCDHLSVIAIDAANLKEHERITALLPESSRQFIIPHEAWIEIKKMKESALGLIQPIGISSFPKGTPDAIINEIQQMEGSLHQVVNNIPLPRKPEELEAYKPALLEALNRFKQEQESLPQKLTAIDRLQKVIDINKETLEKVANKNPSFFTQNHSKIDATQARIAIATKLIQWLGGDETVSFTPVDKTFLTESQNSVAMILQNCNIDINNLPEAPSPDHGI